MKNCDVALSATDVRAMARVPVSFLRPLSDSFLIGAFCPSRLSCMSGVSPPPWIMKPGITRWKIAADLDAAAIVDSGHEPAPRDARVRDDVALAVERQDHRERLADVRLAGAERDAEHRATARGRAHAGPEQLQANFLGVGMND